MNLNDLLETYHEDVATLRRELIGYELLRRENDVYWKRGTSDPVSPEPVPATPEND